MSSDGRLEKCERETGEIAVAALRRLADAGNLLAVDALLDVRLNTLRVYEVLPDLDPWPDDLGIGETPW